MGLMSSYEKGIAPCIQKKEQKSASGFPKSNPEFKKYCGQLIKIIQKQSFFYLRSYPFLTQLFSIFLPTLPFMSTLLPLSPSSPPPSLLFFHLQSQECACSQVAADRESDQSPPFFWLEGGEGTSPCLTLLLRRLPIRLAPVVGKMGTGRERDSLAEYPALLGFPLGLCLHSVSNEDMVLLLARRLILQGGGELCFRGSIWVRVMEL